jgi:DNA-binding PadR family transcriptional regulator
MPQIVVISLGGVVVLGWLLFLGWILVETQTKHDQEAILDVIREQGETYGYAIAKRLQEKRGGWMISHGALYRALSHLERYHWILSRWEPEDEALADGMRPRRRLYRELV